MNLDGGVLVTICIFMLVHTGGFIWWMSRIDTTLKILTTTVERISDQMSKHDAIYAKKEDIVKDFAVRDQQLNTMWLKLDKLADSIKGK